MIYLIQAKLYCHFFFEILRHMLMYLFLSVIQMWRKNF
jgi:hypothetical protein